MHYRKGMYGVPFKNCVCQFKIELGEISPLIWRRILVPSNYNFCDLHLAIQDSLGWLDYHLQHFAMKEKGKKTILAYLILTGVMTCRKYCQARKFPFFLIFKIWV
jgi:hypothetical protein